MKKIKCVAIDDEPIALLILSEFCTRMGNVELATFNDPRTGLENIRSAKPDVVFLDIEMNGLNGLEVAGSLPESCALIFVTAHAQYALEGFNLDAVDFLHKPVAYERFVRAVEKAMRYAGAGGVHEDEPEVIMVRQEYSSVPLRLDEILYIEALGNYVKIVRSHGDAILSRLSIKSIGELLPSDRFLRIHRSYIIPLSCVDAFSRHEVQLSGVGKALPIGRVYGESVYRRLSEI